MKKVLVVEDYTDVAKMVTRLIQLCGYDARHAEDGPAALELAHNWQPEVILLDIGLPGMDGYEVARQLRHEQGYSGKIFALSGFKPEQNKLQEHQIDDYHMKPVDMPTLRKLIDC